MSGYEKCGCGFWTLEPHQDAHNEQRKYGVVTHRRGESCIATPAKPESEQILWSWEVRAQAAEAEADNLRAEVETLRADNADLSLHLKAAWAQVQRVREVCDDHNAATVWGGDGKSWTAVDRDAILRALDGGSDE